MQTWSRRRIETIVLAVLGICAVVPFRVYAEPRPWFLSEMGSVCALFAFAVILQTWLREFRHSGVATNMTVGCLCVTPIVFAFVARAYGAPIPFEISALTTFGAVSLGLSLIHI